MSKIKYPTLIISGARDEVRSTEAANRLYHQILNSRLEAIDNTSHMIPIGKLKY